jgi:SAM-dependent methyltransferase
MKSDADKTNYDPIADRFIAHVSRPDSWNNLYERPNMLALLPGLAGKNVLDLGCATGFYSDYALNKGASVTAVDISQVLLDRLAARIRSPKLKLYRADISRPMPFLKAASFDCVICSLAIDYIKDWRQLFEQLYRVTKKGGRLVLAIHHPFSQYLYLQRLDKSRGYYAFELFEDTWARRSNEPFKTTYYIRPLKEVLRPIIQSKFRIISIDEPLPDERCKEIAPETYEQLMERPGFLFIILEK